MCVCVCFISRPNVCAEKEVKLVAQMQPCVQTFTRMVKAWKQGCQGQSWCMGYERRWDWYSHTKNIDLCEHKHHVWSINRTTIAISVLYSMHMMCMQVFHMHAYSDDSLQLGDVSHNAMCSTFYSVVNEPQSVLDIAEKKWFLLMQNHLN